MASVPQADLDAWLPHRPPFRLIERVISIDQECAVCRGAIPPEAPTADEQGASPLLALELGAQAAALVSAQSNARSNPSGSLAAGSEAGAEGPRMGYLVRIRNARLHCARLPVGQPLRVTVTSQGGAGELSIFDVAIAAEAAPDVLLAEGRLATFVDSGSAERAAAGMSFGRKLAGKNVA